MNTKKIIFLLAVIMHSFAFAGVEPVSNRISGTQLQANAILMVQDDKYPNTFFPARLVEDFPNFSKVKSSTGRVFFGIDHGSSEYVSPATNNIITLNVELTAYDKNQTVFLNHVSKTLSINFGPNVNKDRDYIVVDGAHKLEVKIISIASSNSSVPSSIFLETEIETERYYKLDINSSIALNKIGHKFAGTGLTNCITCAPNEAEIYWTPVEGAEEYELEWTYVNTYKADGTIGNEDLRFDFKNNSTRVRVKENFYKIGLIYDKGYIVYRVRSVGKDLNNLSNELFSKWTFENYYANETINIDELINQFGYTCIMDLTTFTMELNKNWQYSASYAEDGKKKEVISYFDGSLRNRQSVTKINTQDEAIVGETIYDYQGRPAINVLPVPVNNNEIKYYDGFNKDNASNTAYTKEHFDENTAGNTCDQVVNSMNTSSGASNYYSPNQPVVYGPQSYTPDAEKFPFTVTHYTPDNTGRIASQSGVGITHQLGQKETQYLYGQPEQEQLDRLFAAEVGDYKHYKKNIVIDANGQASISYLDLSGKVIATSMAGKPDNVDAVASYNVLPEQLVVSYLNGVGNTTNSANTLIDGKMLLFTKELLVPVQNTYTFVYDMTPQTFKPSCLPENKCMDCVYDIEISVTNDCNQQQLPGNLPYKQRIGKLDNAFSTSCVFDGTAIPSYSVTLSLPPGKYTISKALTVSEAAADFYAEEYMKDASCVQSFASFLASQAGPLNTDGCGITCLDCLNSLGGENGTYTQYVTAHPDPDTRLTEAQWELERKKCMEDCEEVSPCDNLLGTMLADVKVGGQYATFDRDANGTPIEPNTYGHILSVMQLSNYLGGNWRNPSIPVHISHLLPSSPSPCAGYYDEDGFTRTLIPIVQNGNNYSPAVISTTIVTGTCGTGIVFDAVNNQYYTYPENLSSFTDFISQYQLHPSWAMSLVKFHPEFCYYTWCTNNENTSIYSQVVLNPTNKNLTSFGFDSLLNATYTYADALSKGLINNSDINDASDLVNNDPYFNSTLYPSGVAQFYGTPQKADFINHLTNYLVLDPTGTPAVPNKTIKEFAAQGLVCGSVFYGPNMLAATCGTWSSVMNSTSITTSTKDKIWRMYRDTYLTEKQKLQRKGAHAFAKDCGTNGGDCYNGHIGVKDSYFNPYAHDFVAFTNQNTWYTHPQWGCKYFDNSQPGNYIQHWYYRNKIKRFPDPFDNVNDQGDPQAIINQMANVAGAGLYQQTGQCPVAVELQGLLTNIASNALLTANINTVHLETIPSFTKKLYDQLIDPLTHQSCPDWSASNQFFNLNFNTFVSGNSIGIKFESTTASYNSGVALTSGNHIELNSSVAINWTDIDAFANLYLTNLSAGVYNFTIDAIDNGNGTPIVYHLTGVTRMNINDCNYGQSFTDVCEPTELLGDFMNLTNSFIQNTGNFPPTETYIPIDDNNAPLTNNITQYFGNNFNLSITQNTSSINSWVYDFYSTFFPTQHVKITLTSANSTLCTPSGTSISPLLDLNDFDQIDYFSNIHGTSSYTPGSFKVDAWVVDNTTNTSTKYELDGTIEFVDGASAPVPLNALECNSAAEAAICSQPENEVREDLGVFLNDYFTNISCNPLTQPAPPVPTTICGPGNLTGNIYFTNLLSSYVFPGASNSYNFFFSPLPVTSNVLNVEIGLYQLQQDKSYLQVARTCQFEFKYINTALNAIDIREVNNFRADPSYVNGSGISYNFLFEDQNGNTVSGSSCYPLRNCEVCTEPPTTIDITSFENFDEQNPGFIVQGATYIDPSPLCPYINQYSVTNLTTPSFSSCFSDYLAPYSGVGALFTRVSNPIQGRSVFSKTISTITPNKNYNFSVKYVSSQPINIILKINGNVLVSQQMVNDFSWHNVSSISWNSGANTSATIEVIVQGFTEIVFIALDDIYFNSGGCGSPEVINISSVTPFPTTTYTDPCAADLAELQATSYAGAYQHYLEDLREDIKKQYMEKCLSALENFTNTYEEKEFHYTLYYYDQAGNLIKTVPPQGVKTVSAADPDGAGPIVSDLQKVKMDRQTNTRTIFTEHLLATEYEYNSLNQLVKQKTPDNDALDVFSVNQSTGLPSTLTVNQLQLLPGSNTGFLFGSNNGDGQIYTTSNGGQSWTQLSSIGVKNLKQVQQLDALTAFTVGDEGTLLTSTDGGVNWSSITTNILADLNDLYFSSPSNGITKGIIVGDNGTMAIYDNTNNNPNNNNNFTFINASTFGFGNITSLTIDPSSNFEAGVSGNAMVTIGSATNSKIYTTSNGGQTWQAQFSVTAPDLNNVFMETNAMGYAVGVDGTLLKTINAGQIWYHLPTDVTVSFVDVYSSGANLFAVLANGELKQSINGGVNWTSIAGLTATTFKVLSFLDTDHGVAVGHNGVLALYNTGVWSNIPTSLGHNYNSAHYFDVSNIYIGANQSSGLIVDLYDLSTNSLSTLPFANSNVNEDIVEILISNTTRGNFVTQSGSVGKFVFDATNNNWIANIDLLPDPNDMYVDMGKLPNVEIALSKKGRVGNNQSISGAWAQNNTVISSSNDFTKMAVYQSGLMICGKKGNLFNFNGGAITDFSLNTRPLPLYDIQYENQSTVWAVGDNGTILKGSNVGGFWNFNTVPSGQTQNFKTNIVSNANLIAAGDGGDIISLNTGSFAVTANASGTSEIKTDLFAESASSYYATAKNGVLLNSSNGGSTWSTVTTGVPNISAIDMEGVSSFGGNPVLLVSEAGNIIRANNGNWALSTGITPPAINDAYMVSTTNGYAVGDNGNLYSTTNGGVNWTPISTGTSQNFNAIHYPNYPTGMGIAVGNAGAVYFINPTTGTGPSSSSNFNDVFIQNNVAIIVGDAGTCYRYLNGAWTQITITGAGDLNAVYMLNNDVYIVGVAGAIYKSTDGGLTFVEQVSNTTSNLNDVVFNDSYTGYAVGDNGVMVKTVDGGANWLLETTGIPSNVNINSISPGGNYNYSLGATGTSFNLNDQNDLYSSLFFYDKLGRLVASQNAKQAKVRTDSNGKKYVAFSYTKYDALGRIIEVGEMKKAAVITGVTPMPFKPSVTYLNGTNFPLPVSADPSHTYHAEQITKTVYDVPSLTSLNGFVQNNLRKRVSSVSLDDNGDGTPEFATHYTYDIHGNVNTLIQENVLLGSIVPSQRYKRLDYDFDLISGKVNKVSYQSKADVNGNYPLDRFIHKYEYDADNRITNVYTSRDGVLWDQDAKYYYYKHGPLARTELGDLKVQGTDYAYTIHGWIKSVNAGVLNSANDMGTDAAQAAGPYTLNGINLHKNIASDAFGYNLGYYNNDYKAINATAPDHTPTIAGNYASASQDLFNGNISKMITAIKNTTANGGNLPVQGTAYTYDQLNRIKEMRAFRNVVGANDLIASCNSFAGATDDGSYHETFTYDANGNILTLNRNGVANTTVDNFTYQYDWVDNSDHTKGIKSNKLYHVNDLVANGIDETDIDNQGLFTPANPSSPGNINLDNNYAYDEIGNLVRDNAEGIAEIEWNVYGKIRKITRVPGFFKVVNGNNQYPSNLEFLYDASGTRIAKIEKKVDATGELPPNRWKYTYYTRDAQGNTMGVYSDIDDNEGAGFYLKELHLYGSSRLGTLNPTTKDNIANGQGLDLLASTENDAYGFRALGRKNFELSNHLGNVLTVVSDKKIPHSTDGINVDYYLADVLQATDYGAFGNKLAGRNFVSGEKYPMSFNGERDDDETGTQDYGMRIYNPNLGRFLSIDPLVKDYPFKSPYDFAENTPISCTDIDGAEVQIDISGKTHTGPTDIKAINVAIYNQMSPLMKSVVGNPDPPKPQLPAPLKFAVYTNSNVKLPALAEVEKNRKYYTADTRTPEQKAAQAKAAYMEELRKFDPMAYGGGSDGMGYVQGLYDAARVAPTIVVPEMIFSEIALAAEFAQLAKMEQQTITEVNSIMTSAEFQTLRNAHSSGVSAEVLIGGRTVVYEPSANVSGMTLFGENGFMIGNEAFSSETELAKTLLHETYRLNTSAVGATGSASGAAVTQETANAAGFADKAAKFVKGAK